MGFINTVKEISKIELNSKLNKLLNYFNIDKRDDSIELTTELSLGNNKIINLADAVELTDAVNLRTLNDHIPVDIEYFLNNAASDLTGYKKMTITNDGSTNTISTSITSTTGTAVEEFATDSGIPNLTVITKGAKRIHIYCKVDTGHAGSTYKYCQVFGRLYARTTGGVETQIGADSTVTGYITESTTDYNIDIHVASDTVINATDRLILKLLGKVSGSAPRVNNPTLVLSIGFSTDSFFSISVTINYLINNYLALNSSSERNIINGANSLIRIRPAGIIDFDNQSRCRVKRNTAQTMVNNTFTTVIFDSIDYDTRTEFNTSAGFFTATNTGIYSIKASIMINVYTYSAGNEVGLHLFYNNNEVVTLDYKEFGVSENTPFLCLQGATDYYIQANDYVDIRVFNYTGGNKDLYNNDKYNYLSIHKMS